MDIDRIITTKTAPETQALAESLAAELLTAETHDLPHVVCLYGELGAGKTTFVQGFAHGLGIKARILSPTFVLVRRYDIPRRERCFYHVDLYRLNWSSVQPESGIPEILADPGAIVAVEWAEKLGDAQPSRRLDIRFTVTGDGHEINIRTIGI